MTFHVGLEHWLGTLRGPRVAADFNGDGHQDVAFVDPLGRVAVLLGRGGGGLQALVAGPYQEVVGFPVGAAPRALVAADLNGDGHVDVASANSESNDVSVLLGKGDGTFLPEVRYPVGSPPSTLLATDLNGDGAPELVVLRASPPNAAIARGEVGVLANQSGRFAAFVALNAGAKISVESASAADVDNDGHADLILGGSDQSTGKGIIIVWPGNGTLTFSNAKKSTVDSFWIAPVFAVGDINGDHLLDVVAADSDDVTTLLGGAKGALKVDRVTELSDWQGLRGISWSPALVDLDLDGHLDQVLLDGFGQVSVQPGDGRGGFGAATLSSVPAYAKEAFILADFDGDGLADAEAGEGFQKNDGKGAFLAPPAASWSDTSFPVDLDGDSQVDLVRSTGDFSTVLRVRESDGTFAPPVTLPADISSVQATGDLNGDGRKDLVLRGAVGDPAGTSVMLSQADGTLGAPVRISLKLSRPFNGVGLSIVRLRDFDRDGKLDLAALDAANGTVSVLLNAGQGGLGPEVTYPFADTSSRSFLSGDILAADFDGDGACDLVVSYQPSGAVALLHNDGHGHFDPPRPLLEQPVDSYSRPLWLEPLGAADLDGDGLPELVMAGNRETTSGVSGGRVTVLRNIAGKSFGPPAEYAVGVHPTGLVFADLNQDGRTDLVVSTSAKEDPSGFSGEGTGVSVLFGDGRGAFLPSSDYPLGAEDQIGRAVVLDHRGDSRPEIVVWQGSAFMVLSQEP